MGTMYAAKKNLRVIKSCIKKKTYTEKLLRKNYE